MGRQTQTDGATDDEPLPDHADLFGEVSDE